MFICGLCKSNKHNNAMVLSQYRRIHDVKIKKNIHWLFMFVVHIPPKVYIELTRISTSYLPL